MHPGRVCALSVGSIRRSGVKIKASHLDGDRSALLDSCPPPGSEHRLGSPPAQLCSPCRLDCGGGSFSQHLSPLQQPSHHPRHPLVVKDTMLLLHRDQIRDMSRQWLAHDVAVLKQQISAKQSASPRYGWRYLALGLSLKSGMTSKGIERGLAEVSVGRSAPERGPSASAPSCRAAVLVPDRYHQGLVPAHVGRHLT